MIEAGRPVIRVVLVDDHPMFLQGLQLLLANAETLAIVGVAGSGSEAIEVISQQDPDVIVVDLDLPDILGSEVVRRVREAGSDAGVVALSAYSDPRFIAEVLNAGALTFLPKTQAPESLIDAIEKAAKGEGSIPGSYVIPMLRSLRERDEADTRAVRLQTRLSAREQDVLRLLAAGQSVTDAANGLHVSVFTLRGHVRNILSKLEVHSMAQAVALAFSSGFVSAGSEPPEDRLPGQRPPDRNAS